MMSEKCQLTLDYLIFCNNQYHRSQTPTKIMYYTQMLQIMHIQVSYANQLAMTKILGQLHIFQVLLHHKTKAGVQLKKKPMQS